MAKFLDKQQRVIDFQLTPYGKHKLSVGKLKPSFYAFFDTGITYDSKYAGFDEVQTKIHERIKDETQFLEGILSFEEAENSVPPSSYVGEREQIGVIGTTDLLYMGYGFKEGEFYEYGSGRYNNALWGAKMKFIHDRDLDPSTTQVTLATLIAFGYVQQVFKSESLFDLDIIPQQYIPKPNILSFESSIGDARFEGDNTQAAPALKILTCQGEITSIKEKDTSKYDFTIAGKR